MFENRHSQFLPRLLCLNVGIILNAKLLRSYDAAEINNQNNQIAPFLRAPALSCETSPRLPNSLLSKIRQPRLCVSDYLRVQGRADMLDEEWMVVMGSEVCFTLVRVSDGHFNNHMSGAGVQSERSLNTSIARSTLLGCVFHPSLEFEDISNVTPELGLGFGIGLDKRNLMRLDPLPSGCLGHERLLVFHVHVLIL